MHHYVVLLIFWFLSDCHFHFSIYTCDNCINYILLRNYTLYWNFQIYWNRVTKYSFLYKTLLYRGFPGGSVVKNCLPMQETRVWSPIQEDLTRHSSTNPVQHNYWACAPQPANRNTESTCCDCWSSHVLEPVPHNKRSHHHEKPMHWNQRAASTCHNRRKACIATRPSTGKNK